jgi:hypothetical protein
MSYYPHNKRGYNQQIGTRTMSDKNKATEHLLLRLLFATLGACLY